jgi:hypothetical protein
MTQRFEGRFPFAIGDANSEVATGGGRPLREVGTFHNHNVSKAGFPLQSAIRIERRRRSQQRYAPDANVIGILILDKA